jgi:hypothetical protein
MDRGKIFPASIRLIVLPLRVQEVNELGTCSVRFDSSSAPCVMSRKHDGHPEASYILNKPFSWFAKDAKRYTFTNPEEVITQFQSLPTALHLHSLVD